MQFINIPRAVFFLSNTEPDPVVKKLVGFMGLRNGWHYGRGKPPSRATVIRALLLLQTFRTAGARATEVFPDVDGGVLVSGYYKGDAIDTLITARGAVEWDDNKGGDPVQMSLEEAAANIRRLPWETKLSGYYTQITTAPSVQHFLECRTP